jgi:hypothetical protein
MQEDQHKGSCPDLAIQEQKKKQNYLKDNIITNGYDAQDFAEFIENEKEGGIDINNWTLEELETIVQIYQNSRNLQREEDIPLEDVLNDAQSATLSNFVL